MSVAQYINFVPGDVAGVSVWGCAAISYINNKRGKPHALISRNKMCKPTSHFRHLLLMVFIASVAGLASAQQIGVTGTVSDPSGEPLIGVSVIVSGTPSGTTTDLDGKFSIKADPKGRLRFSYVGFETREIDIDGRQVIDVVLDESPEMLDEVVVIGYGTMSDGSHVIGLFNRDDSARNISVELSALGVEGDDWNMRDLWRHADEGKAPATITVQLPAHGCKIVRLSK